jgi:hypothetical protein
MAKLLLTTFVLWCWVKECADVFRGHDNCGLFGLVYKALGLDMVAHTGRCKHFWQFIVWELWRKSGFAMLGGHWQQTSPNAELAIELLCCLEWSSKQQWSQCIYPAHINSAFGMVRWQLVSSVTCVQCKVHFKSRPSILCNAGAEIRSHRFGAEIWEQ